MKLYRGEVPEVSQDNEWFKERFPDGKYVDIEGLCKMVTIDEVRENDWSLTPGRYVGVAIELDEDFDYQARLLEIQGELDELNEEAVGLSKVISDNLKKLIL
ncbi:MAG: N-6 DNA methylase [Cyclobacteriaceae bacterium]